MKKKLYLLIFPVLLIACAKEDNKSDNSDSSDGSSDFPNTIGLMTEGNDTDPGSRLYWNWLRLRDPNTGMIPANIGRRERAFAATLPVNNYRAYNWDQRGPFNVGGRTRAIAFDVLDENIWLAGSVTGGIWRSTDAGMSWDKVTDDLDPHSITSITQDTRPGHENVWYAGTGEKYGVNSQTSFEALYSGDGIIKSIDGGLTWFPLTATQSNTPTTYLVNGDMDFVWRVVTDPSDMVNDVVLAAVYNGIVRSEDGGDTWTEVLGFNQGGFQSPYSDNVDLVVTSTGVFYATFSSDGPDKGVWRSPDGINWTDITPSLFPASYGRLPMAINPLDENVIWMFGAASTGHGNQHGVFRYEYISGDGSGTGGAWSDRSDALPEQNCSTPGITTDLAKLSTQQSFDVHIGIHPTDTAVIYIAGTSIWRNKDAFTHDSTNQWVGGYRCETIPVDSIAFDYQYTNHHPDQHYLTFLPSDPSKLVNANDGGVYVTVDALADSITWESRNNGYISTQHYAVMIEPGEATSDIVFGGMQDNGIWWTNSPDVNTPWKRIGLGDGMYGAVSNSQDYYITCKQRGRMYLKDIDANGDILAHERIDPEGGPSSYNWANSFKVDPNDDNILYWNGKDHIWKLDGVRDINLAFDMQNKDTSIYWQKLDSSETPPGSSYITDIETCIDAPGSVWYGTSNGRVYRLDNASNSDQTQMHLEDLTGSNWPGVPPTPDPYVSCVSVDPYHQNNIVVTFANYGVPSIWHTTNGGQVWEDISGNLETHPSGSGDGPAVFWAEYYVDGTIFVGTSTGLYSTGFPDGVTTTWALEEGIGNVPVDHMDFRAHDGYFAVATHGLGIFTTHLQSFPAGVEESSKSALTVYPTLATDIVNVFTNNKSGTLEVYNLSGQRLHQTKFNNYEQINVAEYPAGTYIVVFRSGTEKWTKKIVKR